MNGYVFLVLAITFEVFSTSMMKASLGFTRLYPSVAFVFGMGFCFYFLAQTLSSIPLSIAYAIWSGIGTALTAVVAIVIWKEPMNWYVFIGMVLIIAGVFIINLKGSVR